MNMNEKKSAFIAKIAEKDSAAQETEIAAMVNWGKASSRQEALEMIKAHPGEDFADIAGSVLHGIPFQEALDETDFTRVKGKYKFKCVKSKEILIMHTFLCAGKKEK